MTVLYVDADACPVKAEAVRVAARHGVRVVMVSDGGVRPNPDALVETVVVASGADAADDWIAERIGPGDICITGDIPLAARCLEKGAQALRHDGRPFTEAGIGNALATREIMRHRRETGEATGGPPPFRKQDRSAFLNALETTLRKALRVAVR